MRKNQQQSNFYQFKPYEDKYRPRLRQDDPDWQFQKVQSVYEVTKDGGLRNGYDQGQYYNQNSIYKAQTYQKLDLQQKKVAFQKEQDYYKRQAQINYLRRQKQRLAKNPSSKSNSETNIITQNQSLEYLSSQQPSFSNKGQFTVFQDFNLEHLSPLKAQKCRNYMTSNAQHDWQLASFASGNKNKMTLKEKCIKAYQFIQQLKFMKEGFESKLKQQKISFVNEIQQVKKLLFKLNIKYEKQMLQFTKKQSRPISRQASIKQSIVHEDQGNCNQLIELKNYCRKLEDEKIKTQQRYQLTLKKYQKQIQMISQQFEKKLALQRSNHYPNRYQNQQCINCTRLQQQNKQKKNLQGYQMQIWKNRLKQQQQNHAKAMKRLQEKVLMLQQEFEYLQKQKGQTQKILRQKQKQIVYRQSQIDYRLKDIQKRQRQLQMKQSIIEKQKQQLQRKKQKLTDYQLKILKDQRKQKNQIKQKQMLTSQYFNNCQKKRILSKGHSQVDRSDSVSSRGSKIDINSRLKQIQMMRNKNCSRNYDENTTSRNSSKDSRTSAYKQYTSSRVNLTGRNLKDYGISPPLAPQKQSTRENTQTIKLSQKLNRLTETLQRQLRQMD